jgi:DNA-binding response OmpR family regulator
MITPQPRDKTPPRATILIIDDDRLMARALLRVLKDDYDVRAEHSAVRAQQRFQDGERFDVVLSDVVMPDLTGVELYQWMLKACPDQAARVIFITGGSPNEASRAFLKTIPDRVIRKPFERQQLLTRIEALLAGR